MKITFVSNIYFAGIAFGSPQKITPARVPKHCVCVCVRTMNDNGQGTDSDDRGDNGENDIVAEKRP